MDVCSQKVQNSMAQIKAEVIQDCIFNSYEQKTKAKIEIDDSSILAKEKIA